jgi:diaminopimelate epimerase
MRGMITRFVKMHGCGNDFVIIDARAHPLGLTRPRLTRSRAAAIADRHTGIGCDQFIVLEQADPGADVFMRIRNPDGSEAGACGNATRCVADILFRETGRTDTVIRTISGELPARRLPDGQIEVDMGPVRLDWQDIPLREPADTVRLDLSAGGVDSPAAASMGNPHATFFVPDLDALDIPRIGPTLEHAPIFPERANIGFAQVLDPETIRLRVWERGAGLTLACGSGACAALVNAHRRGLAHRRARVIVDGGTLGIAWRADGHVLMAGPAVTAFHGTIDLDSLPA